MYTRAKSKVGRLPDFVHYDDKGNIVYYYRPQNKGRYMFTIHDMYDKEIGSIDCDISCCLVTYHLYDEYKQMIFYIELRCDCCSCNYTIYGADKNIISNIPNKFGCCDEIFEEYDKYNTKTKEAIGKRDCSSNTTYYENDQYGNPIFIIRYILECSNFKFKIYDPNEMEINFSNKTIFNDGFTNIQKILILQTLFHIYDQQNS